MKTLCVAVIIVLGAISVPANAGNKIPSTFIGEWCFDQAANTEGAYHLPSSNGGQPCTKIFAVDDDGIASHEWSYGVLSVGKLKEDIAPTGPSYTITVKAKCQQNNNPNIKRVLVFELMRYKFHLDVDIKGERP